MTEPVWCIWRRNWKVVLVAVRSSSCSSGSEQLPHHAHCAALIRSFRQWTQSPATEIARRVRRQLLDNAVVNHESNAIAVPKWRIVLSDFNAYWAQMKACVWTLPFEPTNELGAHETQVHMSKTVYTILRWMVITHITLHSFRGSFARAEGYFTN